MKDKLDQFISNLNGQFVEVSDATNKFQCMDLVYNWVFALSFPKATIKHLYAYQAYTEASDLTRQFFDVIPNTPEGIPEAGDIVVWNKTSTNIAGHIGIATGEGTTSKFSVFEQNNPLGTNAHVQERNYTNVLGWLRPKNMSVDSRPQWLVTLLQEKGLTIKNESEIRILFDKAGRYDQEVKELYEQLKTGNETLSAKSQELAVCMEELQKAKDKASSFEELYNTTLVAKNETEIAKGNLEATVANLEAKLENATAEIQSLKERIAVLEKNAVEGLTKWQLFRLLFRRG